MQGTRFSDLTEGQRACLRLVYRHMSSKEIARSLDISKDTVDQRLDRARRLLGCATRIEAARAFAEYEDQYHRIVYDPGELAATSQTPPSAFDGKVDRAKQLGPEDAVRSEQVADRKPARRRLRWPYAEPGGERNELSTLERFGWILLIAVAIPVLLGSLLSGLWALGQVAFALKQHLT